MAPTRTEAVGAGTTLQDWICVISTTVTGLFTAIYGDVAPGMLALIGVMLIDFFFGTAASLRAGAWNKSEAAWGAFKRFGYLLLIYAAVLLGGALDLRDLPKAFIGWFMVTEGISALANAGLCGIRVPNWVGRTLDTMRDQMDRGLGNKEKGDGSGNHS